MSAQCIPATASTSTLNERDDVFHNYESHYTLALHNMYATAPMAAVQPTCAYAQPDEEELHTSFEQAISDRVTAMNGKLRRMASNSSPLAYTTQPQIYTQPQAGTLKRLLSFISRCQRGLLFGSLTLALLLIGFDLMGLLVLSIR